jgi:acetoin utilization deacetylase AcuC-like enzyme/GNAT superfamily N-acetyltransferase
MIRIRVIHGSASFVSKERLGQVQELFRLIFPELAAYADRIGEILRDPIRCGYRLAILVAEGATGRVNGFALVEHFPQANCCFLDFIGVRPDIRGGGIGGALYEAAREYCQQIGATGLYLEVDPDVPELTPDPARLEAARKRVRFYEQYGVRVIDAPAYSEPVGSPPTTALLLYDGLGRMAPLSLADVRRSARAILTHRFGHAIDTDHLRHVVDSFRDDPVRLRPFRYVRQAGEAAAVTQRRPGTPWVLAFALVSTPKHEIHHVRERGYFERPVRVKAIQEGIGSSGLFANVSPRPHGEKPILAVHDGQFVHHLQTVCSKLKEGRPIYPDTFPIRLPERRPKELPVQAGYYCIDSGTPLYRGAYVAARAAVDTALTAADEILAGRRLAYAVCRPPGHHAGRRFYGGFCYFNNAAVAARYLDSESKTTILDIDFHHGNGTQDIFYATSGVLTVSIHGHPDYAYPYFTGYEDETGTGDGLGPNRNFPLPPQTDAQKYLRTFDRAVKQIEAFKPDVLIVALGYDILQGDPTGTFSLKPDTLREMGSRLVAMGLPVLVVQEGGYHLRNIRRGSAAFFAGCAAGT